MKTYNITQVRKDGLLHNRIRFTKLGQIVSNWEWLPEDKETEAKNIRAADIFVIKNPDLGYKPRKLKPCN
jgi:hypothetical protein